MKTLCTQPHHASPDGQDKSRSHADLFTQTQPIPLAQLAAAIHLTTAQLKYINWDLRRQGMDSGIVQEGSRWWVTPKTFYDHYYSQQSGPCVRYLTTTWDANQLLQQEGIFFLRDVCELIPFNPNQLRYQTQNHTDPRRAIGIWKDPTRQAYLVDMPIFAKWITRLWRVPSEKT